MRKNSRTRVVHFPCDVCYVFSVGDGVRRGEAELAFADALPSKCRAALSGKNRRHLVDACEGEHRRFVHTIFPSSIVLLSVYSSFYSSSCLVRQQPPRHRSLAVRFLLSTRQGRWCTSNNTACRACALYTPAYLPRICPSRAFLWRVRRFKSPSFG